MRDKNIYTLVPTTTTTWTTTTASQWPFLLYAPFGIRNTCLIMWRGIHSRICTHSEQRRLYVTSYRRLTAAIACGVHTRTHITSTPNVCGVHKSRDNCARDVANAVTQRGRVTTTATTTKNKTKITLPCRCSLRAPPFAWHLRAYRD